MRGCQPEERKTIANIPTVLHHSITGQIAPGFEPGIGGRANNESRRAQILGRKTRARVGSETAGTPK